MSATATHGSIHRPDPAEYRALVEDAGLYDRSQLGKLGLSGPDAAEFLDSLLSQDIAAIAEGSGADATLLTHKGRMLAEVRVLRVGPDWYWLDTERAGLQALFDALNNYRVGHDVQLHKRTLERGVLSLIGPRAADVLGADPGKEPYDNIPYDGARLVRTRTGIDVICETDALPQWRERLNGATPVAEDTAETLRIERGRPRFGVELDETTMPQEAGIHERTVSYKKGCYVGQETVARLYWKGKPNRHLRRLSLSEPVHPGTPLTLAGTQVGELGSCAVSPTLGAIGLALLRREAEPGATLHAGSASATVTEA